MSLNFDNLKNCFSFAIDNIIAHGDTDIFLFPYETRMFQDIRESIINSLMETYKNFDDHVSISPPINIDAFSTSGYLSYRWTTQIDPYWNAFFLGLTLHLSKKIEIQRKNRSLVYSYRINPNLEDKSIFDKNIGWKSYQEESILFCKENDNIKYILSCDIADFYTRIYHHPLENALNRLDEPSHDTTKKILKLLQIFSKTTSYGLPVGGAASRILAELALNKIDNQLSYEQVKFKRFVDDYYIFCDSIDEARTQLGLLSTKLMTGLGLTIQKHKTNIYSKEEFISIATAKLQGGDDDQDANYKRFMSLDITYDPYSQNADENYELLKQELQDIDLLGLLGKEIQKAKINQSFSKRIIKSLSMLSDELFSKATITIFDNLEVLYPIYTNISYTILRHWEKVSNEAKQHLLETLGNLIRSKSYIIFNDINLSYTIKILSKENTESNLNLLMEINKQNQNLLIKSIIYQVMIKWEQMDWISDKLKSFPRMDQVDKRLAILSSYILGDEGQHWRKHYQKQFNFLENMYKKWGGYRKSNVAYPLKEAL